MKIRSLLMAMAFCTGVISLAGAKDGGIKTYSIIISAPAAVGNTVLAEGEYTVSVIDGKATFVSSKHKVISSAVKIEAAAKKFGQTQVVTSKSDDGKVSIKEIDLGGSTTKLEFGL